MRSEAFYLSQVIQATTPESAWNGVVGLARDVGVAAVVKTRYRNAGRRDGEDIVKLELPRLYLDPALTEQQEPGADIPAQAPSSVLWSLAPTDQDAVRPRFDPAELPLAAVGTQKGGDPFVEWFLKTLFTRHGIHLRAILTVSDTPAADDVTAEFLTFFAQGMPPPDVISLLGSVAGAYAGKAAVLAALDGGGDGIVLKPMEIECIRWAVAGKSLQDIADILGISYRSVRYQIDQARERYGYATNLQTYVRAAVDYGLDPMVPPDLARDDAAATEPAR